VVTAPPAHVARRAVFWANGGAFLGFYLLLAAGPAVAAERGGAGAAGVVTAVLMGVTVLTQLAVPAALRRWPATGVLAVGLVLLGAPALAFAAEPGYPEIVAITAVRGVGFGLITVVGSLMVARLAADGTQGRAVGLYGLVSSGSGAFAPAIGLALIDRWPLPAAIVMAAPPLVATVMIPRLGGIRLGDSATSSWRGAGVDPVPVLVFLAAAAAFGGVYSYVPLLASDGTGRWLLTIFGVGFGVGRLLVGRLVDRGNAAGRILIVSVALTSAGMALLGASGHTWSMALGAAAGALGVGAICTTTLVMLIAGSGPDGKAHAATAWNVAYDAGSGAGGLLLGLLAAQVGVADGFVLLAVALIVVGMPPAVRAWRTGSR